MIEKADVLCGVDIRILKFKKLESESLKRTERAGRIASSLGYFPWWGDPYSEVKEKVP
jgi:hypothetical protein